jgi:hypothetical protein
MALFEVADGVKILGPPEVTKELAEGFPALAWEEVGLATQTVTTRVYVQSSSQANWCRFLDSSPTTELSKLLVHNPSRRTTTTK